MFTVDIKQQHNIKKNNNKIVEFYLDSTQISGDFFCFHFSLLLQFSLTGGHCLRVLVHCSKLSSLQLAIVRHRYCFLISVAEAA